MKGLQREPSLKSYQTFTMAPNWSAGPDASITVPCKDSGPTGVSVVTPVYVTLLISALAKNPSPGDGSRCRIRGPASH